MYKSHLEGGLANLTVLPLHPYTAANSCETYKLATLLKSIFYQYFLIKALPIKRG